MKKRLLLVLLATSLYATSSYASVFMLQFGSFETEAEAQSKLQDLNTKHGASLSGMRTSIRSIALPPDNLTVYRTQAGPVSTREQAQSICSQFASSGDECYVVETAMVDQGTPVGTQPASAPAVASAASPVAPTASLSPMPAPSAAPAPLAASETAAASTRDAQSMAAINSVSQEPAPTAPAVMPAPMPTPMAVMPTPVAASTPQPLVSPSTAPAATTSTPSAMEADLAAAAAQQQARNANPPAPAPRQEASTIHSIWWHLDPFTSETEETATHTAPAPAARPPVVVNAAPAPVVSAQAPAPTVVVQSPAPLMAPVTTPPPAPIVTASAPVMAAPMMLPPPPAPLRAEDRAALAAGRVPPSAMMAPQPTGTVPVIAQPAPIVRPAAPAPVVVVAPFKASPSVPPGGGEQMVQAPGNVRVGEAQRVPVTSQIVPPPPPVASVPGPVTTAPQIAMAPPQPQQTPSVSLHPSATVGEKTLWAQIGQFNDAQAALAFWDGYRRSHPDFPVVRVRVTSPYQLQSRGMTPNVSLRVGPFARPESINHLCASMPEDSELRCGLVSDLGISAEPSGRTGYLPDSRYHRTVTGMR